MPEDDPIGSMISRVRGRGRKPIPESEKRIIAAVIVILIVAVAFAILLNGSFASAGAISSCKRIVLVQQRNECIAGYALRTSNYSACSYISSEAGSYSCVSAVALQLKNPSICTGMGGYAGAYDSCVSGVAYAAQDAGYCTMIRDANESACSYGIARAGGFASIGACGDIDNASERSICAYAYDYGEAARSRNQSYCSMLPDYTDDSLMSAIFGSSGNATLLSQSYLYYYSLNVTPMGVCYYGLAQSLGNESLCSHTGNVLEQACQESLTTKQSYSNSSENVSTLCASVPSYAMGLCRYSLITNIAIAGRNLSECYSLNTTGYRYSCVTSLADSSGNISYCNGIATNATAKLACEESASVGTYNALGG